MNEVSSQIGCGEREKERNQEKREKSRKILEFWPEQRKGRGSHQLRRRLSVEQSIWEEHLFRFGYVEFEMLIKRAS